VTTTSGSSAPTRNSRSNWSGLLRLLSAGLLALTACAQAESAGPAPHAGLQAGVYENLLLAVSPDGRFWGYYHEEQGEGVTKSCSFFLTGEHALAPSAIKTWVKQASPGEVHAGENALTLIAPAATDYPGCGLVLPPQIAGEGLEYSLLKARPWIELRTAQADKVWFFSDAELQKKRKAYVVKGDVLGVVTVNGGALQVEYAHEGKTTAGWISAGDVILPTPP